MLRGTGLGAVSGQKTLLEVRLILLGFYPFLVAFLVAFRFFAFTFGSAFFTFLLEILPYD